jgi:glycosyltransferase involved in cell wall biosynthesis
MTNPSLSVVIPTYNRARTIGKAIDSVLAQTFQDYEVIVVDDGSQDDTKTVLTRFGNRIHLISQENRGVSAARNTGIRAAHGKWIAFLDSDDEWRPTKLARQMDCLEKRAMKVCFTRCVAENGEILRDIDELLPATKQSEIYCFENAMETICQLKCHPLIPSMVVEKELLEQAGLFDESIYASEDTRLIYNLAFLSGFIYVDCPLVVVYRRSHNSLTYDLNPETAGKRFSSYLRVQVEAYWRMLEVHPNQAYLIRKRIGCFISQRAEVACAANQLHLARVIAKDGIPFAGDIRTFVVCLGIYLCPFLLRSRFRTKWYKTDKE